MTEAEKAVFIPTGENLAIWRSEDQAMIKDIGNNQLHGNLAWTQEGLLAFETIKQRLQEAPALTLPDYSKNFLLYVSTSMGGKYACAVLCQPTGTGMNPQPISYYSTAYSDVELGLPPCYRAMVGLSVQLIKQMCQKLQKGIKLLMKLQKQLQELTNWVRFFWSLME
uniref:Reverse transcriptase/retrotransposon-derived protein RNase H-like domain-containing protein n=1 Tax=Sander lucioperca TaxID=283035 RepID=A0A8D0ANN6_SANLU